MVNNSMVPLLPKKKNFVIVKSCDLFGLGLVSSPIVFRIIESIKFAFLFETNSGFYGFQVPLLFVMGKVSDNQTLTGPNIFLNIHTTFIPQFFPQHSS